MDKTFKAYRDALALACDDIDLDRAWGTHIAPMINGEKISHADLAVLEREHDDARHQLHGVPNEKDLAAKANLRRISKSLAEIERVMGDADPEYQIVVATAWLARQTHNLNHEIENDRISEINRDHFHGDDSQPNATPSNIDTSDLPF